MGQELEQDKLMGKNIKTAREALGLTQEQLAAKLQVSGCDISRATLAKSEVGIRHIRVSEIKAISEILKVDYDFLFKGL
ncbi:MAG: helix-turn-helix domain-containing protein [Oscillospiraceae bacterium]|nr:helix-turn-helix domain-containing protein [Oscillospiraceae bacterium]